MRVSGALSGNWLLWSAIAVGVALIYWVLVYRFLDTAVLYALKGRDCQSG
jgi:hypothetical protein